jgi:putative endonuclease
VRRKARYVNENLIFVAPGALAHLVERFAGSEKVIGSNPICSTKSGSISGLSFYMEYFTYIIYSNTADKYYVGHSDNLNERLVDHQSGISPYTSRAKDWALKYSETFATRSEAIKREYEIKRKKSRKYIEWLIAQKKE